MRLNRRATLASLLDIGSKLKGAEGGLFCYLPEMKRHRTGTRSANPIFNMQEAMAERTRMNQELLISLAHAFAGIEKTQRKFRNAVVIRLSRIETMVQMIHGAQIAEAHLSKRDCEEKMNEHAEAADAYISEHSRQMSLKMVRYVYGTSDEVDMPRDRRRKWSDWEI